MKYKNNPDLIKNYWSKPCLSRQMVGTYPLGNCGLFEIPYRHYFELKHLKKIVNFNKSMNVLELGCGNGRWVISLASLVKQYTGVDFSRVPLDIAEEDVKANGLNNVEFHECSLTEFSCNRSYDVVYFSGVSQYLEDEELKLVLDNLSKCLKAETILVDRSTVNFKKRELLATKDYFSILRTPEELAEIYGIYGFRLQYQKRSYRFLRGYQLFRIGWINRVASILSMYTRPISFYIMICFSFIADVLNPIPFEGGDRSHDFLIFKRDTSL